jgi:hypothetical protein
MERLPTEIAMTENMKRFKSIPIQEDAMSGRFITSATSSATPSTGGRAGGSAARP